MKKKTIIIITITLLLLVACTSNKSGVAFKKSYESLNGVVNSNGKEHRTVSIPKNNPFVEVTPEEIVTKIENKESFYVYFGSTLCPWCRSVIEKAIEVANDNGIEKVYYVDIWNSEGEEILRDKYILDDNNKPLKTIDGTESYHKLLTYLDSVLSDYTYTLNDQELSYGEKRIYAPNFIYIAKGKPIRMTTGISSKQEASRDELTEEILADEERQFDDFFINVCDDSC